MLAANVIALTFIEPELWAIEVYIAGIQVFDQFGSCDFDLNPMTFKYKLDLYCLEMYRVFTYKLPTSRLSKVIL